jgi:hypothetical protein
MCPVRFRFGWFVEVTVKLTRPLQLWYRRALPLPKPFPELIDDAVAAEERARAAE